MKISGTCLKTIAGMSKFKRGGILAKALKEQRALLAEARALLAEGEAGRARWLLFTWKRQRAAFRVVQYWQSL